MTTKAELLARAKTANLDPDAFMAASFFSTDDAIEKRRLKILSRNDFADSVLRILLKAGLLAAFLFAFFCLPYSKEANIGFSLPNLSNGSGDFMVQVLLRLLGASLVTIVCGFVLFPLNLIIKACYFDDAEANILKSVAGTDECEKALELLQNYGPEPALYRDLALQERSELRFFDIDVMRALARRYEWDVEEEIKRKNRESACKMLHGVPATAPVQEGV